MKLSYRIMWVDDDSEFYESQGHMLDELRSYVESEGFDLELVAITSPDQINFEEIGNKFDLMVIDYNLTENGPNGDQVIKTIREHDCLTEVIFYSASGPGVLRQHAATKELEGVFFSSKDPDALCAKVESVFDLTVRKVLDIENMRGLVMAGVADIDHQLTDLITAFHGLLGDVERVTHRRKILEKMLPLEKEIKKLFADGTHRAFGSFATAIEMLKELEPQTFESLIDHRGFDSHKRVESVESFCKDYPELKSHKEDVANIKALLMWRNALAHQMPRIDDETHYFSPNREREEAFDAPRRKELRKTMREHRLKLIAVKEVVTGLQQAENS